MLPLIRHIIVISRKRQMLLYTFPWAVQFVPLRLFTLFRMNWFQTSITLFATYVLSSPANILDPSKVFVTFSLVNSWSFVLQLLPLAVNYTGQAVVSIKRILEFLMLEEADSDSVVYDKLAGACGTLHPPFSPSCHVAIHIAPCYVYVQHEYTPI